MAIYRTDRNRRILGDRVVARKKDFFGIHPATGEVHGVFTEAHNILQKFVEDRRREDTEDSLARENREKSKDRAVQLYSWAYHQVEALLQPNWDSVDSPADAGDVKERLFPLGNPTEASVSTQIVVDGFRHFLEAAKRENAVAYPPKFIQDSQGALNELVDSIAGVTRESSETDEQAKKVALARERWDNCYNALRDVTSCFLRLEGSYDRLPGFFRELPSAGSGQQQDKTDPQPA